MLKPLYLTSYKHGHGEHYYLHRECFFPISLGVSQQIVLRPLISRVAIADKPSYYRACDVYLVLLSMA